MVKWESLSLCEIILTDHSNNCSLRIANASRSTRAIPTTANDKRFVPEPNSSTKKVLHKFSDEHDLHYDGIGEDGEICP
jgi:hypothetical protein